MRTRFVRLLVVLALAACSLGVVEVAAVSAGGPLSSPGSTDSMLRPSAIEPLNGDPDVPQKGKKRSEPGPGWDDGKAGTDARGNAWGWWIWVLSRLQSI